MGNNPDFLGKRVREGYDFIGFGLTTAKGHSIDIFLYDHGSQSVHLIGVYSEDFDKKKKESAEWIDYFLDSGFTEVSRSLTSNKSQEDLNLGYQIREDVNFEEVERFLTPYFDDINEVERLSQQMKE